MIFTAPHYYLGVIQLALVAAYVLIAVFVAGRNRVLDRAVIWLIGAYLLLYKTWEYGPFRAIPVDLSAISYFLFGIAAFVPFRPLKAAGSFSAMLSGSIYFVTMILYPEMHVENLLSNRWFLLTMAMVNHNLMFLGGMFMCAKYEFGRTDHVWMLGWIAFYLVYYQLVAVSYGVVEGVTAIVGILQGTLVAEVLGVPLTVAYFVLYYAVIILAFALILTAYILLNRAFARRRKRKKGSFLPPLTGVRPDSLFAA